MTDTVTTDEKPATPTMPPLGSFVWQELMTPDAAQARAFYGGLFGWTFTDRDMGEHGQYTIISNGAQQIAGIMPMVGEMWNGIPPHWMGYVSVDDTDAAAAKVVELGGKVCVPPFDIPEVGRICVINDPAGAVISLIAFPKSC